MSEQQPTDTNQQNATTDVNFFLIKTKQITKNIYIFIKIGHIKKSQKINEIATKSVRS